MQEHVVKVQAGKTGVLTPSTEASLSENSSHGGHTPPKDRGALRELEAMPQVTGGKKRTRRSNRRRGGNHEIGAKLAENMDCPTISERPPAKREVVTVSDLCFGLGPSPSPCKVNSCDAILEECMLGPISPCRTSSGPVGIWSTNPCKEATPTVAPASTRIPDQTRTRYCSMAQTAPTTLDLRLCTAAPDSTIQEGLVGSPCKGGHTCSTSDSLGIFSATPCNIPTAVLSATSPPTSVLSATSPPSAGNIPGLVTPPHSRLTDASARTPVAAPARGASLNQGRTSPTQLTPSATPDVFSLGIEPGPFSPCHPRVLFPSAPAGVMPEPSSSAGTVVADTMRSWLQHSGLPSGSQALEAELRAAVPEAYED